jgi:hypothetical protein
VAEILQVLFRQAAFQEGAAVHSGRGVALEINQIARLVAVTRVEEMVEAHFQQRRQRGVRGNMAPDAGIVLILPDHHGHRIPANQALDAALHRPVAGIGGFIFGADRINVRCVELNGHLGAVGARAFVELLQQKSGAIRTGLIDHLVQRLNPLRSLLWIQIHNPLVQFLVHGYFYYRGRRALAQGAGLGTMWSWSEWNKSWTPGARSARIPPRPWKISRPANWITNLPPT